MDTPAAIIAPNNAGVKFHNSLTVFLNGKGSIKHVINDQGDEVSMNVSHTSYVCEWSGATAQKLLEDFGPEETYRFLI